MIFNTLLPLIKKTGSTLAPEDFHRKVNVVFHDIEAANYDQLHSDMWESLQEQIFLLVNDIPLPFGNLKLLDIGCGTGLSTELLLKSKLGPKISEITLLDTSLKMLELAKVRSESWNKKVTLFNGEVKDLQGNYDVILVCSVLHHIPDLTSFLKKIDSLQIAGSIFIHLQDPNGDYMNDAEYLERVRKYEDETRERKSEGVKIVKSAKNILRKFVGKKSYMDLVNDKLLEEKVITKRMTSEEIWSVTDIHVENLPFSIGTGISLKKMQKDLPNYKNIEKHSYGFFGPLKSDLPAEYQALEQELIDQNALNGRHISGTWTKSVQH